LVPSRYAYAEAPEEMIQNTKAWGDLAAAHGVSLPAVAVAFGALPECVEKLVIGMASAEEVAENVAWLAESGQKTVFSSHLYIKMLILPRQARDKHT
jgi:aryl-alcohol dehydrogenase-like predicted oxidoreductase